MNCARCNQPIEMGQIFLQAQLDSAGVIVHDFPCPQRFEITDGRVILNGVDVGAEENFDVTTKTWLPTIPTLGPQHD